jgi:hypothetical protein
MFEMEGEVGIWCFGAFIVQGKATSVTYKVKLDSQPKGEWDER